MSDNLIVVSKVKEVVKNNNKSMGKDVPEKLSQKVQQLLKDAITRANENGRQTLMGKDI